MKAREIASSQQYFSPNAREPPAKIFSCPPSMSASTALDPFALLGGGGPLWVESSNSSFLRAGEAHQGPFYFLAARVPLGHRGEPPEIGKAAAAD
jgi:hypothetical protein